MQLNSIRQFLLSCQHSKYIFFYCLNKLISYTRQQNISERKTGSTQGDIYYLGLHLECAGVVWMHADGSLNIVCFCFLIKFLFSIDNCSKISSVNSARMQINASLWRSNNEPQHCTGWGLASIFQSLLTLDTFDITVYMLNLSHWGIMWIKMEKGVCRNLAKFNPIQVFIRAGKGAEPACYSSTHLFSVQYTSSQNSF